MLMLMLHCSQWISDTEESELSFYKNGRSLGVAFRLDPSQLKGHALYPHVLCKNCSVSLNLDPVGAPWYGGPAGFTPLSALQPHKRTRAPRPPASREECEVNLHITLSFTAVKVLGHCKPEEFQSTLFVLYMWVKALIKKHHCGFFLNASTAAPGLLATLLTKYSNKISQKGKSLVRRWPSIK